MFSLEAGLWFDSFAIVATVHAGFFGQHMSRGWAVMTLSGWMADRMMPSLNGFVGIRSPTRAIRSLGKSKGLVKIISWTLPHKGHARPCPPALAVGLVEP